LIPTQDSMIARHCHDKTDEADLTTTAEGWFCPFAITRQSSWRVVRRLGHGPRFLAFRDLPTTLPSATRRRIGQQRPVLRLSGGEGRLLGAIQPSRIVSSREYILSRSNRALSDEKESKTKRTKRTDRGAGWALNSCSARSSFPSSGSGAGAATSTGIARSELYGGERVTDRNARLSFAAGEPCDALFVCPFR
jgi:hypothetical protein